MITTQIQEDAIVSLLQKKDKQAIRLIYEHYGSTLYGVVFRIVKKEVVAQEIMREAFKFVWEGQMSYLKNERSLCMWLIQIFRKKAIQYIESKKIIPIQIQSQPNPVSKDRSYLTDLDSDEFRARVGKLPPDMAEVIEHVFYRGCNSEQLSALLGITLENAKLKTRAAIKLLSELS